MLPHGGPFARDSWVFDQEVQFLASRGYAVLQPNFRGSTGYGRDFVARGYGQLGAGMIDDIDDGVDWLIAQGIADRSRVCIMGSSYGGYAATWAAMRSPERYRCAISCRAERPASSVAATCRFRTPPLHPVVPPAGRGRGSEPISRRSRRAARPAPARDALRGSDKDIIVPPTVASHQESLKRRGASVESGLLT